MPMTFECYGQPECCDMPELKDLMARDVANDIAAEILKRNAFRPVGEHDRIYLRLDVSFVTEA